MMNGTNLFDEFGGTRKMAGHLDEPPSTVNSWKAAGRIPAAKQPDVLRVAQGLRLDVSAEDIIFPLRVRVRGASDHDAAVTFRGAESSPDSFADPIGSADPSAAGLPGSEAAVAEGEGARFALPGGRAA